MKGEKLIQKLHNSGEAAKVFSFARKGGAVRKCRGIRVTLVGVKTGAVLLYGAPSASPGRCRSKTRELDMRPPPQKCDAEMGPAAKCEVLLVEVQEIVEGLQKARSSELACLTFEHAESQAASLRLFVLADRYGTFNLL